jgi:hypothetical protein
MKKFVAYLVRVITKRVDVLLTLVVAVIAVACSTDAGQETAVPPEEGAAAAIPAATEAFAAAVLPVMRTAPAWDNDVWINSEAPVPLEDLRGKAVLLELSTSG